MALGYIISLICPLVYILSLAFINYTIFHKAFFEVLPLVFIESAMLLFVFGFFDLRLGFYLLIVITVVLCGILFYKSYAYKTIKKNIITEYFDSSLYAFVFIYLFVYAINLGKDFSKWDEFSHWGIMVKELFYHNKYYFFEGNSLTIHNEYPPFLSLIEYLWCMLSGGYKEKFLYNGKILVSISFLFPFVCSKSSFHKISKEKFFSSTINILIAAVFIILLPVYFSTFFYSTIYAEGSLVTAFVICI